jgi:tRNA-Thr(GGU) m(6)t(6)A37 methyltransferase TsaA
VSAPGGAGFAVRPVGRVVSELLDPALAPRQADEGAPAARVVLDPEHRAGLLGLRAGQDVLLLTWLHLADRTVLQVHPRSDPARPLTGVFATRSPDRPNPLGLHEVRVSAVHDDGFTVEGLEAVDGTPVVDVKPVLAPPSGR